MTKEGRAGCWRLQETMLVLLVALPFCNVAKLLPDPAFWSNWIATLLAIGWLMCTSRHIRAKQIPYAALGFLVLAAIMAIQVVGGMAEFPVGVLVVIGILILTFLITVRSANVAFFHPRYTLLDPIAFGILIALGLNALAAAMGYFGYALLLFEIVRTPISERSSGLVGQANHLAVLAVLGLASAIYLYRREKLGKKVIWVVLIVAAAVCTVAGSRIGILAWLTLIGINWKYRGCAIQQKCSNWWDAHRSFSIAVVFGISQIAWMTASLHLFSALDGTALRINSHERTEQLVDAFELWRYHPWLGVGQGNFAQWRLVSLSGPLSESNVTQVHNLIFHALAELGILGGVTVVVGMSFIGFWIWRSQQAPAERTEIFFISTLLVVVLLHSMVEHPLWFMRFLFLFALALGLLPQPALKLNLRTERIFKLAKLWQFSALLLCVLAAWDYGRVQALTNKLVAQLEVSSTGSAQISLSDAAHIANFTMFPVFPEIMLSRALPVNLDNANEKLQIATRAMNSIPNAETIARYVAFSVIANKVEQAETMMGSIRHRNIDLYDGVMRGLAPFAELSPPVNAYRTKVMTAGKTLFEHE